MNVTGNTVGLLAALAVCGLAVSAFLAPALHALRRLPKRTVALLLLAAVWGAVEADKPRSPPRMPPRRVVAAGDSVTPEEIARGYRLDGESNDALHSFEMPADAVCLGNVHLHGAATDFGAHKVEFDGWSFPFGPGDTRYSAFWWFLDGRIRTTVRGAGGEIATGLGPSLAVQGESRIWLSEDAGNERTITWERFFQGGDTNRPANAQITLRPDGGFLTRSNGLVRAYSRVDPHDWDGDGLDNAIDPQPTVSGGDCFGTGAAWLNAQCGNVLSAVPGTNGTVEITWNTNSCEAAYYWLQFTALRDGTRVTVDCDGESRLGDMVVIANAGQVCRIPVLAGPAYHLAATHPLAGLSASAEDAFVRRNRSLPEGAAGGEEGEDFEIQRPVELRLEGSAPNLDLVTTPYVDASITGLVGVCCLPVFSGASLVWECLPSCSCDGFLHGNAVCTASWEGYSESFRPGVACRCQEYNATHPERWLSLSAPAVLMLDGGVGTLAAGYAPYEPAGGVVTLRCKSGAGRVAFWADEWKQHPVSLPLSWDADEMSGISFYIEPVTPSATVGDVVFEYELALTNGVTNRVERSLTVGNVKWMDVASPVAGQSANGPPFLPETTYTFFPDRSSPEKHLVVPFQNVATLGADGFTVRDFTVTMTLVLEPDGLAATDPATEWELIEALPETSGSLEVSTNAVAKFVNPKKGGVYRFRARCEGSPWTEANVVLPLAGAGIDTVFQQDFASLQTVMSNLNVNAGKVERQMPSFGMDWFVTDAAMDYLGRVDNAAHPTVWRYNQVNDWSGFGAVATWHGIPVRMAKLGNFMAGYGTEILGVWKVSRWLSQRIGTGNDATATASWNAGVAVAQGGDVALVTAQMVTNTWNVADQKERNLWPNASQADNHTRALLFDFNLNLSSPRVIEEGRNP